MFRGTTPTISLTVTGLSALQIHSAYLTIKQGEVTVEKALEEMTLEGDGLKATLTQAETLSFRAGSGCMIQLRVLTENGAALATEALSVPVKAILKDGEIT